MLHLEPPFPTAVHAAHRHNRYSFVVVRGDEHTAPALGAELALHYVARGGVLVTVDRNIRFGTFRECEILRGSHSQLNGSSATGTNQWPRERWHK